MNKFNLFLAIIIFYYIDVKALLPDEIGCEGLTLDASSISKSLDTNDFLNLPIEIHQSILEYLSYFEKMNVISAITKKSVNEITISDFNKFTKSPLPDNENLSFKLVNNLLKLGKKFSTYYVWRFMDLEKLCLEYNQGDSDKKNSTRREHLIHFLAYFHMIDFKTQSCSIYKYHEGILKTIDLGSIASSLYSSNRENKFKYIERAIRLQMVLNLEINSHNNDKIVTIAKHGGDESVDNAIRLYREGLNDNYARIAVSKTPHATENAIRLKNAGYSEFLDHIQAIATSDKNPEVTNDAIKLAETRLFDLSDLYEYLGTALNTSYDPPLNKHFAHDALKLVAAGFKEGEIIKKIARNSDPQVVNNALMLKENQFENEYEIKEIAIMKMPNASNNAILLKNNAGLPIDRHFMSIIGSEDPLATQNVFRLLSANFPRNGNLLSWIITYPQATENVLKLLAEKFSNIDIICHLAISSTPNATQKAIELKRKGVVDEKKIYNMIVNKKS